MTRTQLISVFCFPRFIAVYHYVTNLPTDWKGDFVNGLPDEAIDAHLKMHDKIPDGLSLMHLYPIDVSNTIIA